MATILSIIIVNWNVWEDLRECFESIYSSSFPEEMEVILIDNASVDHSVEKTRATYPRVKIIANSTNVGFPKANNQALVIAKGEYVLYLNPDTVLQPDTLDSCVNYLRSHKEIGLLGCKIFYPDGSIQYECARNFPTLRSTFWEVFYLHMLFPKSRLFAEELMGYWDHNSSREVSCLAGAFMMSRRSILERMGGMDENVFMFLEDVDLCYRIKKEGWKVYYLAETSIIHKSMKSQKKLKLPMTYENATAKYEFFKKHYGITAARVCRMILLLQGLLRLIVSIFLIPITFVFPKLTPWLRNAYNPMVHLNLLKWVIRYKSLTGYC